MNGLKLIRKVPSSGYGLTKEQKQAYVEAIWAQGGEGIILKHRSGKYSAVENRSNKGPDCWCKCKKTASHTIGDTIDGWLCNPIMGSDGTANEGLIAGFCVNLYLVPSGQEHTIAKVTNFTREDRIRWTEQYKATGTCEVLGKCVEVEGMDFSSTLDNGSAALVHARFVRYRDDKQPFECTLNEALLNDAVL